MNDVYQRMLERYESGETPWDAPEPPPEVIAIVETLPPGSALDLGCGYGRTAIYLAQHGWRVDGVDFVEAALVEARERAEAAGLKPDQIHFHQADVTDLHMLQGPYTLAVDVGCAHALDPAGLAAYRDELKRLLAPGAIYLLFARLRPPETSAEEGPRGMDEALLRRIFVDGFVLDKVEHGITEMSEESRWASAWFWFRRR